MSIEQRRHIRFSLDIPGIRYTKFGEKYETALQQVSIGGCLLDWDERIYTGEEFRLLVQLPNKNWLPLLCKTIYKFDESGIGAKFLDISRFEQDLIAKIITQRLAEDGLPLQVSPFQQPPKFKHFTAPTITDPQRQREEMLEEILSSEK